jgi:hypothetical protein
MALDTGVYLLWKPPNSGSGYVLVQQRASDFRLSTPGGELDTPPPATHNDYGNAFVAMKRELFEESGIDLRSDQLTDFVWLGSSGGVSSDEHVYFARVWTTQNPVRAMMQPTDLNETRAYPFGRNGFRVGNDATTIRSLTTNHAWVSLDQILDDFARVQGGLYKPTATSVITDNTISYSPFVRTNFEMLRELSQQGGGAYRPYNWPRPGNLTRLAAGTPYVPPPLNPGQQRAIAARQAAGPPPPAPPALPAPRPPTVGQQRLAQAVAAKKAADKANDIIPRVILELMTVLEALTAGTPAAAIATNAIASLNAMAGIYPAAAGPGPGSAAAAADEIPEWATGYFAESELTTECKEAKFIGADCVPRAAYDIIWALNQHITTGQLDTAHAANLADYQALDAEIKRLTAAGAPADVVEKKQLDFDKRYRNVSVPVVDPTKPGPATRVLRVPNPYRAHSYRQGVASFANPTPSDISGNPNLQSNIDILKTVATPEFIADSRAAKLLLEDLWFCAKNPGGPGCFMADGLAQLEQYKAGKVQKDGAAQAKEILKGPATDLGNWLEILKRTATAQ